MILNPSSKIIRERFKTLIATPQSLVTQYDNLPFTRPENARYCRFSVRPGDSQRVSVGAPGNNRFRGTGIWLAMLFEPLEKGEDGLIGLSDLICQTFITNASHNGVTFRTPSTFKVGRAGSYWQVNVSCPWYCDYIG